MTLLFFFLEESIDSQSNPTQIDKPEETEDFQSTIADAIPQPPIEEQTIPINSNEKRKPLRLSHAIMHILDEKDLAALNSIFHDTVYFLIKSGNEENVSLAKAKVKFD